MTAAECRSCGAPIIWAVTTASRRPIPVDQEPVEDGNIELEAQDPTSPPYAKAWDQWQTAELIVMLLPANRTEQGWWQRQVEHHRRVFYPEFQVEFLPGRLRFLAPGASEIKPNERPPFGCCLLIWDYPNRRRVVLQ